MKEVSDNLLVFLLIIAVGIAVINGLIITNTFTTTLVPITGAATVGDNATATVIITTTAAISFVDDSVDWGSGSVDTGASNNCSLDTLDTYTSLAGGCTGFTLENSGLALENTGNSDLRILLASNVTAEEFIGSGGAVFEWNITENEAGSCNNESGGYGVNESYKLGTFFSVVDYDAHPAGSVVCWNLSYRDENDNINISLNLTIPYDAPADTKYAKIIAFGVTIP